MIGMTWTGWDGSVWDLRTGPVRLTADGIEGLLSLKFDSFTRDAAARDGQRFQGWRAQARNVLFPVILMAQRTEAAWLAMDRAWWKTMQPGKVGTLTVSTSDGGRRRLSLRFIDDGGYSYKQDPTIQRVAVWPIAMVADDPYWYGNASWGRTFAADGDAVNFLGGAPVGTTPPSKGTPIVLGSSFTTSASVLTNPGDVNAWPVYTLAGPLTGFSITFDGGTVSADLVIARGQKLVIDTSPTMQTAYLYNADGSYTNVLRSFTSFGFRPIRPGIDLKLNLKLNGAGTLTVTGDPRYFKAW
jgi:hypothetical protein